jgi:hypothetical protein
MGAEAAASYRRRLLRTCVILLCLALAVLVVFGIGYELRKPFLLTVATLLLGTLVIVFLLITAPVWGLAYFEPVRWVFKVLGFFMLWFLLLGLGFLMAPVNEVTAVILPLGSAALALLFALTGVGPNPRVIYTKVLLVMFTSVLVAGVRAWFPESFERLAGSPGQFDSVLAGMLKRGADFASSPSTLEFRTLQEFERYRFFDQNREPLVWYFRGEDGHYELFNGPGVHPRNAQVLKPITPVVVAEVENRLRKSPSGQTSSTSATKALVPLTGSPPQKDPVQGQQAVTKRSLTELRRDDVGGTNQAERKAAVPQSTSTRITALDPIRLEGEINRSLRSDGLGGLSAQVTDDLIVTLKGSVTSASQKDHAMQVVRSFSGIRSVRDQVFVVE